MKTLFDVETKPTTKRGHGKQGTRKLRRRLSYEGVNNCGIHFFKIHSLSRADVEPHHLQVDSVTGECRCECPNFIFSHAKHHPDVHSKDHLCKHLKRAVALLVRRGFLDGFISEMRPCFDCGTAHAKFEVADEHGEPVPGKFICEFCVTALKTRVNGGNKWGLP